MRVTHRFAFRGLVIAALLAGGTYAAAPAQASSLTATYFDLTQFNPDVAKDIPGVTLGLVDPTLDVNGMPVVSAASLAYPIASSNHLQDTSPSGELLWWTPHSSGGNPLVVLDGRAAGPVSIPFNETSNLYPFGAGSDGGANGYLAIHLAGSFDAPAGGSVTFNLGSDDDAWVFVNGQLVVDNGGVHALAVAPTTVSSLLVGTNTIDVFFVDRHDVQSGLYFDASLNLNPVPEPAGFALLGAGLVGLAAVRRRGAA